MPFDYEWTDEFERGYAAKDSKDKRAVDAAVELLATDPSAHGLHSHLIDQDRRIWESYAKRISLRITWQYSSGSRIILRKCCKHNILSNP